jgi:hypothetical protein
LSRINSTNANKNIGESMKWNSIQDGFPKDKRVLVTYLNPFFGKLYSNITIGVYNEEGVSDSAKNKGWTDVHTENNLLVTHWATIPEKPTSEFDGANQTIDFINKFKGFPNFGSVK